MKNIAILGSTGSIGLQALDVIRSNKEHFNVIALSCNSSIDLLEEQINEFNVPFSAVMDESMARTLSDRTTSTVMSGMSGINTLACIEDVDIVLNALVGSVGITPTVTAIKNKKDVALANKETLVAAGAFVMALAQKHGTTIYPVDSEHSAIFQCLHGEDTRVLRRIILTCSGGPFLNSTYNEIATAKAVDALKHPRWNMGNKISIDSATLMNKGLEVIEASMLFGIDYDHIDVVIHPQSIIHSLVEFVDGSTLAQMSHPDMKLPIQYALTFPARYQLHTQTLNLASIGTLNFEHTDTRRFPCLDLAYNAGRTGGSMPCVLNAANEVYVSAFLQGKIGIMDIPRLIEEAMSRHSVIHNPDLDDILAIDSSIKEESTKHLHLV